MRLGYTTITPATVHRLAYSVLESALGFQPFKRSVTVRQLLDLILLIAGTTRTLYWSDDRSASGGFLTLRPHKRRISPDSKR
jgi:hypothetical protein